MILLVLFAFLSGFVTILSPCILPILPIVLSTSFGGQQSKLRPWIIMSGFIFSFTFFTLFLSSIIRFTNIPADSLRLFSVIIVFVFGLTMLVPKLQRVLEQLLSGVTKMSRTQTQKTGLTGGFLIGLSLGLLWSPCVGPILASIISLAVAGRVTFEAIIITIAYSLGTAIPMISIIIGGSNLLKKLPWLTRNTAGIQKVFGVIMILVAVLIYTNMDRKIQMYILNKLPGYGLGLTKIEDNEIVRSQIDLIGADESNKPSLGSPTFNSIDKILAPEIVPGGVWINSEPITSRDMRGKVILIDFWTYSCINCQRTLPYLRNWWQKYNKDGLIIIGVHSPEFVFEQSEKNLRQAIADFQITYPVVQDNKFETWRAFSNNYWPAKYIIDKDGYIRYSHFGEGKYDETEKVIQELLRESGADIAVTQINNPAYRNFARTPETYLGYARIENFASQEQIEKDALQKYTFPQNLGVNEVAYAGEWTVTKEFSNPKKGAKLQMNFNAKEVFLVMKTRGSGSRVKVLLDGKAQYFGSDAGSGVVTINADRLYKIVNLDDPGAHVLELEFEDGETEIYAFTFG